MRKIKFRQPLWDEHDKFLRWHYWGFIKNIWEEPEWEPNSSFEEAKEQSQQYTEVNGKGLYEGDIVRVKMGGIWQTSTKIVKNIWDVHLWLNRDDSYYRVTDIEVVGNTTENPELLGTKANLD